MALLETVGYAIERSVHELTGLRYDFYGSDGRHAWGRVLKGQYFPETCVRLWDRDGHTHFEWRKRALEERWGGCQLIGIDGYVRGRFIILLRGQSV